MVRSSSRKNAATTRRTSEHVDDQHPQRAGRRGTRRARARRCRRNIPYNARNMSCACLTRRFRQLSRATRHPFRAQPFQALTHSVYAAHVASVRPSGTSPSGWSSTTRPSSSRSRRRGTSCSGQGRRSVARLGVGRRLPEPLGDLGVASGEMIQSIHLYMQFGCSAFDEIIHVSDHPVAPSRLDASILAPFACGEVDDHLPRRAGEHRCRPRRRLLIGVERPVLADEGLLL